MSQFFTSGGQSIGASASALPMNIQDWFPLGWTGLISLQSKGLSRVFSNTTVFRASILWHSAFHMVQLAHLYMTTGKTIALTIQNFVGKVMSLLFNMLSRFVIAFFSLSFQEASVFSFHGCGHHPRWFLEPKKIKSVTASTFPPSFCHEVMGPDALIFIFWMLSFKPAFSFPSFTFNKRFFSSSLLSTIWVVSSAYLMLLIFLLAILITACASSSSAFHKQVK